MKITCQSGGNNYNTSHSDLTSFSEISIIRNNHGDTVTQLNSPWLGGCGRLLAAGGGGLKEAGGAETAPGG